MTKENFKKYRTQLIIFFSFIVGISLLAIIFPKGIIGAEETLEDAKINAHAVLNQAIGEYSTSDYTSGNWATLITFQANGFTEIDNAIDIDSVNLGKETALSGMAGVEKDLLNAKNEALNELAQALETYNSINYTYPNWTNLNDFKIAGDIAISNAIDFGGVINVKTIAIEKMASIETIADILDDAKILAHTNLNNSFSAYLENNYTPDNWAILIGFKNTGDTTIDEATDLSEVDYAEAMAKVNMSSVVPLTQTLSEAKISSRNALSLLFETYKERDYTAGSWVILVGFKNTGDGNIETATILDDVYSAQTTATEGMAGVEKDLANARAEAHISLTIAKEAYSAGNYTSNNWNILVGFKTTGDTAIDNANTLEEVAGAKLTAINGMTSVEKRVVSNPSSGGSSNNVVTPPLVNKIGDLTGDNVVNEYDLAVLMLNWGQNNLGRVSDLNKGNMINEYDLALLMLNWSR